MQLSLKSLLRLLLNEINIKTSPIKIISYHIFGISITIANAPILTPTVKNSSGQSFFNLKFFYL